MPFKPERSAPYLLNKAPSGGLYTPAARRVAGQLPSFIQLRNSRFRPVSRDTLKPRTTALITLFCGFIRQPKLTADNSLQLIARPVGDFSQ